MAEREMRKICAAIRERWDVERVAMAHRVGVCPVGEVGTFRTGFSGSAQRRSVCLRKGART